MRELRVGDPRRLATDVGPVIDAEARAGIERAHRSDARARRTVIRCPAPPATPRTARFVAPTLIEIDAHRRAAARGLRPGAARGALSRASGLDALIDAINATGYGLTLRHAHAHRRDRRRASSARRAPATSTSTATSIGAVVGVQPFGGEGLSGTGPKAGGPLYLRRLLQLRRPMRRAAPCSAARMPLGEAPLRGLTLRTPRHGDCAWPRCGSGRATRPRRAGAGLRALRRHARPIGGARACCPGPPARATSMRCSRATRCCAWPRRRRPAAAAGRGAGGGRPRAVAGGATRLRLAALPEALQARVRLRAGLDTRRGAFRRGAAARRRGAPARGGGAAGAAAGADRVAARLRRRRRRPSPLERLVVERSLSINTAAAGGNASLMAIG